MQSRFTPALLILLLLAEISQANILQNHQKFSTWEGLEGDKWASVWLIFKHNLDAQLTLYPIGSSDLKGFSFDVPLSAFKRNHRQSTYEVLLDALNASDPVLNKLAVLVRDLEINAWKQATHAMTQTADAALRRLDKRNNLQSAPIACYITFFDRVMDAMRDQLTSLQLKQALNQLVDQPSCLKRPTPEQ